ncbi:MAG TPA: rod shape-determining protein MreC [Candidatus Sulfotelmatobacter sp.]|nr:rod shape-determining protein MreC [Candidatus Sulfotelmatobacter sp.]
MFKQKNYIALGTVALAAVLILSLPSSAASRLKLALGSLFLPLFGLAGATQQLPSDLADSVLPRRELLREIDNLRRENTQLQAEKLQANAIAMENDQLRSLVGWEKQQPWKMRLAHVVTRDPANWWRTIEIDLGSRDGMTANLPVMTTDGLVGRIASVGYTRSEVVLVGDPKCKVSAMVDDPGHDIGVLSASGPLDSSLADLTYLPGTAALKSGQQVITSGIGGVFPKGIPLGQIVDSRQVDFGLYTEARVKLSANLGSLEVVCVLTP